jgi:hypothetical protein
MTAALVWILRILVVLMIVRLVVRAVASLSGARAVRRSSSRAPERLGGTLVRDPHCGTYVPVSRALTIGRGPDVLHFCSPACRDAWAAARGGPNP